MTDLSPDVAAWIGRTREASDVLTGRLVAEYRVTLGTMGTAAAGAVPPGAQWLLAPDTLPREELGRDGHPRPGLVVPKLPLPRRMWAGGEVRTAAGFAAGEQVSRRSTVADVAFKEGRSGRLGFVTVNHVYAVGGDERLTERQDIVYREDPAGPAPTPAPGEDWSVVAARHITPDPTLLFRYSALTFNGHRIHYDAPYATSVEGYDGLVVHGPLQATWMQCLAAEMFGAAASIFRYRGVSPLTATRPVTVEARETDGGLELRVRRDEDGVVTMQATATR
ncbi:MaoC family dehydratase N-terminal domain-containing protein [Acuticoccus sp. MNP-M23]|uniref:FAS1-like dehydratase domain-containing protein n=1 Tax=Acuticoccus sp. MNP-M23 TaxID=3072793 RepID=UPI0028152341|nr:MaoC family dehydratase N-terminal domain-containing protein [Acuticoccus sp. MNP-M23]WMS43786.1 MaoC family dehydratase N-terminal domain-containing protein [Acuticoccus sp. MNP-M23]